MVSTPSDRRPIAPIRSLPATLIPTRSLPPRPPTRSRPTAPIPSPLKAGRMPHPPCEACRPDPLTQSRPAAPSPREAEAPDRFSAEGGIVSSRPRESANGPGRVGRTLPIRLTTGRQPRAFRTRSRSTCRFSIPASVGKRKVNLSVLAVLRYWVHLFGSAANIDEDTVNRSAFPQESVFVTTGIVTGSERSTHYRNPAKTDTTLHRRTGSTTQGRRTHPRIRTGPSHLLGRQNDELQAASLVEAGIPIPAAAICQHV